MVNHESSSSSSNNPTTTTTTTTMVNNNKQTPPMLTPDGSQVILVAKFDFESKENNELCLRKNERLILIDNSKNWWLVRKLDSTNGDQMGYVPSNYVKKEKKKSSLFDKIIPKKLQFSLASANCASAAATASTANLNNSAVFANQKPYPQSSKNTAVVVSPSNNSTTSPVSPTAVKNVIKYNANESFSNNASFQVYSTAAVASSQASPPTTNQQQQPQRAIVKHKYTANKPDEITLSVGIRVNIVEKFGDGWWRVCVSDNEAESGLYPSNYLLEELDVLNSSSGSSFRSPKSQQLETSNTKANNSSSNNAKHDSQTSVDRDVEYVRCIFSHVASSPSKKQQHQLDLIELSVNLNEILRIIDDDQECLDCEKSWLKVMNSQGSIGLIPSKCVQPIIFDSKEQEEEFVFIRRPATHGMFAEMSWYYGNISRAETNRLLNKYAQNGDFLLRDSEREAGNFSISLKSESSTNKHFKVLVKEGKFLIGKRTFEAIEDLLVYYHQNPIYDQKPEKLYLIKPFEAPLNYSF